MTGDGNTIICLLKRAHCMLVVKILLSIVVQKVFSLTRQFSFFILCLILYSCHDFHVLIDVCHLCVYFIICCYCFILIPTIDESILR